MKFSLACVSAVVAPVIAVGTSKDNSISIKDVVVESNNEKNDLSSSSFSSSYSRTKNTDVFKRLVQRRDVRDEVRNEPNKLKNVEENDVVDNVTECSPAVKVNKKNKIDAGYLPVSSCDEKQICIARDDADDDDDNNNNNKESSAASTSGVCVSFDDVPASYWETETYGSLNAAAAAAVDDVATSSLPARQLQQVDLCDDVRCKGAARPKIPSSASIRDLITECVDPNTGRFNGASCPYSDPIQCWDTSAVTDMSYAFYNQTKTRLSVECWDTSEVTTMASMFQNAEKFNSDLGFWDVSNVENFNAMFYNTDKFNQNLKDWNTKSATDMAYMFGYAEVFNQPIGDWYTGEVTDFGFMFSYAGDFGADISGWNTGKATTMKGTFSSVYGLTADLNGWNTARVQNMNYTFFYAYNFNSPLDGWDTSQVTTMNGLFSKAKYFNQPIGGWDVSQVTSMDNLFAGEYYDENYDYGITSFNSDINDWNVSKVKSMSGMFYMNGAVPYLTANINKWNTSKVTDMKSMFEATYFYGSGYINNLDVSKVKNMSLMFYSSSFGYGAVNNINGWKTSSVVDMTAMFGNTGYFDDNLINGWDVSLVTSMSSMFYNSTFDQTLEDWDVGSVKNMTGMFYTSNFNKPLDKWNLNKDVDMSYMFEYASYFNQCLSTWASKTSGDVVDMFNATSCPGLSTPPAEGPWCQTAAEGCVAQAPEPVDRDPCYNDPDFVTLKGKNCRTLLFKLKPKQLRETCAKSFNTASGKRSVSESCPALCNPDECCQIDKDFTAVLVKGNKKCKKWLQPFKKDPEKLKKQCARTVETTLLGEVVVKDHCSNMCNLGCKPPLNCNDKGINKKLIVPNKVDGVPDGTKSQMTCVQFFEGKDAAKVCQKKKLKVVGVKRPVKVKTHCPNICNNRCKLEAAA